MFYIGGYPAAPFFLIMVYFANVPLCPPSKSNSYKITRTGKFIKSKEVKAFEKFFILCLPAEVKAAKINTTFRLEYNVYLRNAKQDLDNTAKAILDALEASGAIANDNLCYELEIKKYIDKTNPRIELKLIKL